jgi:hypothetical protein
MFTFPLIRRPADRPSTRRHRARRPLVDRLEGRQLLTGIVGNHIGTSAVAAIVGNHIGASVAPAIKGEHVGS